MTYSDILHLIINPRNILLLFLTKTAKIWPDKLFLQIKFRLEMGQNLNLNNPKTFNEKLQWLKLYNRKTEYTTMVDKYAVKEYVANKIGEEYIIPTLGIWNRVEDIDWESLPNQFVLKTTHGGGGGGIVICKDKSIFIRKDACQILQNSLNSDIFLNYREWPYKNVSKRIIAEEYKVDESGCELKDYKFFCFNGRVEFYKVDFDRFINHRANYYDRESNLLPFFEISCPSDSSKKIEKPINLEKMIELAEVLAENIPFVRIDFYNINGKIYFGEMTFFPAAGMGRLEPEEWDLRLGEMIIVSKKYCNVIKLD